MLSSAHGMLLLVDQLACRLQVEMHYDRETGSPKKAFILPCWYDRVPSYLYTEEYVAIPSDPFFPTAVNEQS